MQMPWRPEILWSAVDNFLPLLFCSFIIFYFSYTCFPVFFSFKVFCHLLCAFLAHVCRRISESEKYVRNINTKTNDSVNSSWATELMFGHLISESPLRINNWYRVVGQDRDNLTVLWHDWKEQSRLKSDNLFLVWFIFLSCQLLWDL